MASLPFPDTGTRMVLLASGRPAVNKVGILYADPDGTDLAEIYADADGVKGALIASAQVTTDTYGQLPDYWGPADSTDRLYITVNGGPLVPVDADYNARLDVLGERAVEALFNVKEYEASPDAASNTAAFTDAVAAAVAAGGGVVWVPPTPTAFHLATPLQLSAVKNITFRGAGREASRITCDQQFIVATNSSDACRVEDLRVECVTATNTYNGVDVDYPRRWWVTGCYFKGFGGDSVVYRGGLNSGTARNYILAKDPSGTNGHAGVFFTEKTGTGPGTTTSSTQDYVAAGIQYGIYVYKSQNNVITNPICEGMQVGIRFENSIYGALVDPYTEATTVEAVQMHDSIVPVISGRYTSGQGITRTWSGTAATDRYMTRIGRNWIDAGKGLLFGGNAGATDPTLAPSIRAGTGSPEGAVTGVVGSLWMRSNGGADTTVYRKESGTGNTGWVASASGVSAAIFAAARNNSTTTIYTMDRDICSTSATLVAGTVYAQHFTPAQAMPVTQVGFCTSTTATTGATLIRFGLCLVNGDGTLTLVARSANDTSLLGVAGTVYDAPFDTTGGYPASYTLVPGQRYATALIVVGGTPGNVRAATSPPAALLSAEPRLCSTLGAGQADLPTSPTAASATGQLRFLSLVAT